MIFSNQILSYLVSTFSNGARKKTRVTISDILVPIGPIILQIFSILILISYLIEYNWSNEESSGILAGFGTDLSYTSIVLLIFFLTILPKVIDFIQYFRINFDSIFS